MNLSLIRISHNQLSLADGGLVVCLMSFLFLSNIWARGGTILMTAYAEHPVFLASTNNVMSVQGRPGVTHVHFA